MTKNPPRIILINPPLVKPCEPPGGPARLAGALEAEGIEPVLIDANLEGIVYLLNRAKEPPSAWGKRAFKNRLENLRNLKDPRTYRSIDRYSRAVSDLNRALADAGGGRTNLSLTDYHDPALSPLKSEDLLKAAASPEDSPFFPYFSARLRGLVKQEGIAFAGFSLNYLSQALTAFAMIGFLKGEFPSLTIIAGGGLVTSWMRRLDLKGLFPGLLDHCVAGPGEEALLLLLGRKPAGGPGYLPSYRRLPLESYLSAGFVLPFNTSRGCPYGRCTFCPETAEGNRYSRIDPKTALADISLLAAGLRPSLIHFTDCALSEATLEEIIRRPPGAPWYGFVRVSERMTDRKFLRKLKDSGAVMLKIGIESGSQEVLDSLKKGFRVEAASLMLKGMKEAGLAAYVYLLFGTPAESKKEARETVEFVSRHGDCIDFISAAIFNLPLNSPAAGKLPREAFYEGDLSLYSDFRHPSGWGRRQVRAFLASEFRREPAIRSILGRQPPFFTSNHAPFFVLNR